MHVSISMYVIGNHSRDNEGKISFYCSACLAAHEYCDKRAKDLSIHENVVSITSTTCLLVVK